MMIAGLIFLAASFSHHFLTQAHDASLYLQMNGNASCSGTAIGPHTLLTAEHCLEDMTTLVVNGKPVKVLGITLDERDHAMVRVNITFKHTAGFGPQPNVGDNIYVFGNPGDMVDVLREGIVGGSQYVPRFKTSAILYNFNGFYGDSGSAIFDSHGKIVGVTSYIIVQISPDGVQWKIMGGWPLAFTPSQIVAAETE